MTDEHKAEDQGVPTPDAALKRLERLVGTWTLKGRPLGSQRDSVTGTTRFNWLHDPAGRSFFLQQDMQMDYDGQLIKSHELIGFDGKTGTFGSLVFSNMAPDPWPYTWDLQGDDLVITIRKDPMNATFKARFAADGNSFSGGWRPNPGADEVVNAPYDVITTRVRT
jgi:hypothetical protein